MDEACKPLTQEEWQAWLDVIFDKCSECGQPIHKPLPKPQGMVAFDTSWDKIDAMKDKL